MRSLEERHKSIITFCIVKKYEGDHKRMKCKWDESWRMPVCEYNTPWDWRWKSGICFWKMRCPFILLVTLFKTFFKSSQLSKNASLPKKRSCLIHNHSYICYACMTNFSCWSWICSFWKIELVLLFMLQTVSNCTEQ